MTLVQMTCLWAPSSMVIRQKQLQNQSLTVYLSDKSRLNSLINSGSRLTMKVLQNVWFAWWIMRLMTIWERCPAFIPSTKIVSTNGFLKEVPHVQSANSTSRKITTWQVLSSSRTRTSHHNVDITSSITGIIASQIPTLRILTIQDSGMMMRMMMTMEIFTKVATLETSENQRFPENHYSLLLIWSLSRYKP